MRIQRLALVALVVLACLGPPARAGVLFFVNDAPGFAAAVASSVLMGSEDWSSANSASTASVAEPLQPGIASGPFPNGVNAATGMTVQSNSHVTGGASLALGAGLFYAPAGFAGLSGNLQPSKQLSANATGASFDMLFASVGDAVPSAVSFSPMYYRLAASNIGTITVQVFDPANELLGSTTVPNVADVLEDAFVGVQATDGDVLGRVNVWAGPTDVAGSDNVDVYTLPEASAGVCAGTALVALFAARSRTGSRLGSRTTRAGASGRTTSTAAGV